MIQRGKSRLSWPKNPLTAGPHLNFCKHFQRFSRGACINFGKAYGLGTGTPDLGADGKDYRANSVHAPFPNISARRASPSRSKARGFPACEPSPAM